MNLPNILTLSRIAFAVILIFLLERSSSTCNILAAFVFAIASITDYYDGYLAKKKGLVSDFGKIMDPIADKVLLLSALGVLAHIGMIAWWIFTVIAVREIVVTVSRLMAMRQRQVLAAERAGKIKTVVQIAAVSAILLFLVAQQTQSQWFYNIKSSWQLIHQGLLLAAVVVTIYSGVEYFRHKK